MKLYKHTIYASESITLKDIRQQANNVVDDNKDMIVNMLDQRIRNARLIDPIQNMYMPYIRDNNITSYCEYTDSDHDSIMLYILLKVPYENIILHKLDVEYRNGYKEYGDYAKEYIRNSGLSTITVYQVVFERFIDLIHLDDIEDEMTNSIEESNNYTFFATSYYYDDNMKKKRLSLSKVVNYINSKLKERRKNESKSDNYSRMISKLRSESESGINSIYEQTEAGEYVDSIVQSVEDSLGIWSEPSIQGGQGSITFRDGNTDAVLLEMDYEEYCDDVIDMALRSKSKKEFVSKLKKYYDI